MEFSPKLHIIILCASVVSTTGISQDKVDAQSIVDSLIYSLGNISLNSEDVIGNWSRIGGFHHSSISLKENNRFKGNDSGCFGSYTKTKGKWELTTTGVQLSDKRQSYKLRFYNTKNMVRFLSSDQIEETEVLLDDHIKQNTLTPKLKNELLNNLITSGWTKESDL